MTGKTIAARREDAINFVAAEMDALHYAVTHRDETIARDARGDPRQARRSAAGFRL